MAVIYRDQYNSMKIQADLSNTKMLNADRQLLIEKRKLEQLSRERGGLSKEDLREMQKKFDSASRDIQEELESLREEFGRQLGRQALENKRSLAEIRRLAENNKRDLDSLNKEIGSLEKKVKEQLDSLARQLQEDRKQALYYYDQFGEIVRKIGERFPDKYEVLYPEQLQPGYYALRSGLGSVLEDIEAKRFEAAIGLAQSLLPGAVNMLGLLEFYHTTFINVEAETKKTLSNLLNRVNDAEKPKKTVLNIGESAEFEDDHGIAYWARELYAELKQRISAANTQFAVCDEAHDAEGLTKIHHDLEVFNDQLTICEQIEENERQIHYECCERTIQIYEILAENEPSNNWTPIETHVNEEDLREPVYMTISRQDGFQITIACYPERSKNLTAPGKVRSKLEVFDRGSEKEDAAKCRNLYRNVATVLAINGIELDYPSEGDTLTANSKTFIHSAIDHEGQARNKWLYAAKKAIGLFEEA